ncbi:heat-inducible transcriptional repressor HrcA, partial [bacterium]|nr:heat-inducible transcriptional repressor HrcA [bacterium]
KRYGDRESGIDDVVKRTAKILSTISNYTGLIVAPSSKNTPLRHIEFIKLSSHKLLGILVTTLGDVQNKIVELNEDVSLLQLEKINNFCNRAFVNLTLEQVKGKIAKELQQEEIKYDKLLSQALVCASSVLKNEGSAELYVEGESSLLREPEFADLKKAKQVLEALEEKKGLLHIFEQTMQGEGVKIFIGNEIGISGVEECSVITATYKEKGEPIGTLGVIGPKRMDYSKVISVVDFTAKLLSDILGGKI